MNFVFSNQLVFNGIYTEEMGSSSNYKYSSKKSIKINVQVIDKGNTVHSWQPPGFY